MPPPIVTLTTDFGLSDGFVGTMKGVGLTICPAIRFVDITHEVPPQDVRTGALILRAAHAYFPGGTVHVAVVDPGVGGRRRAILVEEPNGTRFLAPDNGILTFALEKAGVRVRELANPAWFLANPSRTFHGRDVFAPAAAHLAAGGKTEEAGPLVDDPVRLHESVPLVDMGEGRGGRIHGAVIHIDRFGNLITNVDRALLERVLRSLKTPEVRVLLGDGSGSGRPGDPAHAFSLVEYYQEAPAGGVAALFNSWGLLEVFASSGNASRALNVNIDDPVVVEIVDAEEG